MAEEELNEAKQAHRSVSSESKSSCSCGCDAADEAVDMMPDEELLYDLADLFKVFGDTTRIKILYALMTKDRCVADLAEEIGATQSAVSHQLRTLKQSRLDSCEARWEERDLLAFRRPCAHDACPGNDTYLRIVRPPCGCLPKGESFQERK